jgi:hypothetical protein
MTFRNKNLRSDLTPFSLWGAINSALVSNLLMAASYPPSLCPPAADCHGNPNNEFRPLVSLLYKTNGQPLMRVRARGGGHKGLHLDEFLLCACTLMVCVSDNGLAKQWTENEFTEWRVYNHFKHTNILYETIGQSVKGVDFKLHIQMSSTLMWICVILPSKNFHHRNFCARISWKPTLRVLI